MATQMLPNAIRRCARNSFDCARNLSRLAQSWAAAEMHEAKSVVTASADVRQRQRCM